MRGIPTLLLLSVLAGCSTWNAAERTPQPPAALSEQPYPRDARPSPPMLYRLEVHQITLPYGAVSRSDEFWKPVNEQAVELGTYDLLYRNGVRVGQADVEQWEHFREIFDEHPVETRTTTLSTISSHSLDLEMQHDIESQEIFYFDPDRTLSGRSYDRSSNLMRLSFQPVSRRPNDLRVSLVPVVRSMHRRYEVRQMAEAEREVLFVKPEILFELNLVAEVPAGRFLIIAPSSEARWPMSIGNRFFISESETERFEQVLLLVPQRPQAGRPVAAEGQPRTARARSGRR